MSVELNADASLIVGDSRQDWPEASRMLLATPYIAALVIRNAFDEEDRLKLRSLRDERWNKDNLKLAESLADLTPEGDLLSEIAKNWLAETTPCNKLILNEKFSLTYFSRGHGSLLKHVDFSGPRMESGETAPGPLTFSIRTDNDTARSRIFEVFRPLFPTLQECLSPCEDVAWLTHPGAFPARNLGPSVYAVVEQGPGDLVGFVNEPYGSAHEVFEDVPLNQDLIETTRSIVISQKITYL